jgi:hypothetical protein
MDVYKLKLAEVFDTTDYQKIKMKNKKLFLENYFFKFEKEWNSVFHKVLLEFLQFQ